MSKNMGKAFILSTLLASVVIPRGPVLPQNPNCKGIWMSCEEVEAIPMSGTAWTNLKAKADVSTGTPNLADQEDPVNVRVMAKALVYARTGVESYRTQVISACMAAIGTEKGSGGRTLSLGRELAAYVIAADLVGLPATEDSRFRTWIRQCLTETLEGSGGADNLVETHELRPNNWGNHAGCSRAAVAFYLGDKTELDRCAKVFKGYLGDRASYAGFNYGDDLSWQSDPSRPVGINPKGAMISGHSVDGVLPDDQRRAGSFTWPPPKENYVYEGLQGAVAQALILHRAGFPSFDWQDKALLRAFTWLHNVCNFSTTGDDSWEAHLMNYMYASSFPAAVPTTPGKNVGWTDWTHGSRSWIETGIHGVVRDGVTAAPVSGATVRLQSGTTVVASFQTGAYGFYHIVNAPTGTYALVCSKAGLPTGTKNVTLTTGNQLFAQDVSLQGGGVDTVPPAPPEDVRLKE
jgi:hypothetical protein